MFHLNSALCGVSHNVSMNSLINKVDYGIPLLVWCAAETWVKLRSSRHLKSTSEEIEGRVIVHHGLIKNWPTSVKGATLRKGNYLSVMAVMSHVAVSGARK